MVLDVRWALAPPVTGLIPAARGSICVPDMDGRRVGGRATAVDIERFGRVMRGVVGDLVGGSLDIAY